MGGCLCARPGGPTGVGRRRRRHLVYLSHISGRMDYEATFFEGAGLVETHPLRDGKLVNHRGGGLRGAVRGFSAASRCRLIRRLGSIRRAVLAEGLWIDLTYPDNMRDGKKAHRHLRAFLKRMLRAWGKDWKLAGIWKRETQERGAIHFHLMVWGAPYIPHGWIAEAWYEIVGSGNPDHLKAGTSVSRVKTAKRAAIYASKYQSKEVEEGEEIEGRWWGMFGDWESLQGALIEWVVNRVGISRLWRVFDGWRLAMVRSSKSEGKGPKIRRARRRRDRVITSHFFLCEVDSILPQVGRIIRAA